MQATTDHSRLIGQAAKKILAPLGCKQKGRSRLWFDDRAWWACVIEFQPSSRGKGSYLNVGAMWLWNAKPHWSFDDGYRIENFREFNDESQFSQAVLELAQRAATEVSTLRQAFGSIGDVSARLAKKDPKTIWDRYHSAVALGVTGNTDAARSELTAIQSASEHAPWVTQLKVKCTALSDAFTSAAAARQAVQNEVADARALLGLAPLDKNQELWM